MLLKPLLPLALLFIGFSSTSYADYIEPNIQHKPFGKQKVVYQFNMGDEQEQLQALRNASNHIQTVGKDKTTMNLIVFGAGITLLQSTNSKLNSALEALRQQGVKISVCNNTLKHKNLDWHNLNGVKETDIVPAGTAELAYLQQRGFAYIRP